MRFGLSGVNCIYSDSTAVSMQEGPCAPMNDDGAVLEDVTYDSQGIDVIEPAPMSYGMLAGLLLAVVVGASLIVKKRG